MKKISVIGSGTMGSGIAHTFAQHGYSVSMVDLKEEFLIKAIDIINTNLKRQVIKGLLTEEQKGQTLSNIAISTNLKESVGVADFIVEATSENLDSKLKLFGDLDQFAKPETILATNTSSLSITKIASSTNRPDKVIGMHFMNPVPVMQLVEIICGYSTSQESTETVVELVKKINKIPIKVNDYPGFIANRILMPMINEAIFSVYDNVAGVAEIDAIMRLGMAHPMGPLQLADFIGLDICLSILNVLYAGFGNPKYAPCPLLVNMVNAGQLGKKSGCGFYKYTSNSKELVVASQFST